MIFSATKSFYRYCFFLLFVVVAIFFCSCTTVKNYPLNKPFVYETNVNIEGKFSIDEQKDLHTRLMQQLDDSLTARKVQKLVLFQTLKNPPVYDSMSAERSIIYMKALLNSLGYYRDTISYDTSLQVVPAATGTQYRTTINFNVEPGKQTHIDSVSYQLDDDTLQQITLQADHATLLKKGTPFSKTLISSELDRLTDVYRNNGYLKFSREELLAVWDTVGLALLRPTVDLLEQAQQLELLQKRRQNPTADIEVRLRASPDSSRLTRYYVGDITVYPDINLDTGAYVAKQKFVDSVHIISYHNLFNSKVLVENLYLKQGQLYRQSNYLKTINRFNALGAWRYVSIDPIPRDSSDTVDFTVKLTPAPKYLFTANLEGSQNWGNVFSEGNLLGIGVNVGLQNRNFARGANQATTNFRYGTELSISSKENFVQTRQATFSHTIYFPRMVPNMRWLPQNIKENIKTIFALNVGNTDRIDYFNLTTLNTSWGYEFNWKNHLLGLRVPNIEYSFLNKRNLLDTLFAKNQSYKYIFNKGLVASTMTNFTVTHIKNNISEIARFNIEESGLLTHFIQSDFIKKNLFRFVKMDAEFRQTYKIRRSSVAWRVFSGVGYGLPSSSTDSSNYYLPFFKQYIAGGANSMRAWGLRRLGPGSAIKSFSRNVAPDRFGDIQLELNGEYRFYIANVNGVILNSALFTDWGNVWFLRKNLDFPGGEFRFNKLWKDIAVDVGTGLRIDFGIFLVRLDYAYKAKNPSPDIADAASQNKWFYNWKWYKGQLQLGVNYPF